MEKKHLVLIFGLLFVIFIISTYVQANGLADFGHSLDSLAVGFLSFLPLIALLGIIALIVFIGIKVGRRIGNIVTKLAGLILGLIFTILGLSLLITSISTFINNLEGTENISLIFASVFVTFILGSSLFIMGISTIIYSNKKSDDPDAKVDIKGNINQNNETAVEKNIEDILAENNLGEYIDLFIKNKLTDLDIVSGLDESDLEKMGISIMGDRKKILLIFSKEL
jgi:hypothetical protein